MGAFDGAANATVNAGTAGNPPKLGTAVVAVIAGAVSCTVAIVALLAGDVAATYPVDALAVIVTK